MGLDADEGPIPRASLMSLEQYARERPAFRARVIAHKRERQLALGAHVVLTFEDELTVRYQIQEMLRIEKTFEEDGILDELRAYRPLVPSGADLKATMMIGYEDAAERAQALVRLAGIEHRVFVRVGDGPQHAAISDEDMDRGDDTKTSAVHFLRFAFSQTEITAWRSGAPVRFAIEHPHYHAAVDPLPASVQAALAKDFI